MNGCFEVTKRKKKSSEPTWMADWIRYLIKNRRKIFKRDVKRSPQWHSLKSKIAAIVTHRKKEHHKYLKEKLLGNGNSSKNFHTYVNALLAGNGPKRWDVRPWPLRRMTNS